MFLTELVLTVLIFPPTELVLNVTGIVFTELNSFLLYLYFLRSSFLPSIDSLETTTVPMVSPDQEGLHSQQVQSILC
jgi:hypothetical protein